MYACQECGRKFKTTKAAERASNDGCPKCGGVDIDLDTSAAPQARYGVFHWVPSGIYPPALALSTHQHEYFARQQADKLLRLAQENYRVANYVVRPLY